MFHVPIFYVILLVTERKNKQTMFNVLINIALQKEST